MSKGQMQLISVTIDPPWCTCTPTHARALYTIARTEDLVSRRRLLKHRQVKRAGIPSEERAPEQRRQRARALLLCPEPYCCALKI